MYSKIIKTNIKGVIVMKSFVTDKLVCLGKINENGTENEEYRYGATIINVSRFRSLVDGENRVVISFDGIKRNSGWKKGVADYFGVDTGTCSFDNYAICGKAV